MVSSLLAARNISYLLPLFGLLVSFLLFLFLIAPHDLQDLSSLIRD